MDFFIPQPIKDFHHADNIQKEMSNLNCNKFNNLHYHELTDEEKKVKEKCGSLFKESEDSFNKGMNGIKNGIEHQNGNKGGKKYSSTRRRKTRSSTRRRRKKRTHKRGNNKRKVSNKK